MFGGNAELKNFCKEFENLVNYGQELFNQTKQNFGVVGDKIGKFNFRQNFNLMIEKISALMTNCQRMWAIQDNVIEVGNQKGLLTDSEKDIFLQLNIVKVEVARKLVVLIFEVIFNC